jgi:4-hydroxybenzoate polyprenyltransferase
VWFILQLNTAALVTERALGAEVLIALLPSCTLAAVYPFAKRVMPWPQFVLALVSLFILGGYPIPWAQC